MPKTDCSALRRITPFPPWEGLDGFFRGPLVTSHRFVRHDADYEKKNKGPWEPAGSVEPVLVWESELGQMGGYGSNAAALLTARCKDGDEAQRVAIRAALADVAAGAATLNVEFKEGTAEKVGVYKFAWETDFVVLLRWTTLMSAKRPTRAVCWVSRAQSPDKPFNALRAPGDQANSLGAHVAGDYEFQLDDSYVRLKTSISVPEPKNAGGDYYGALIIKSGSTELNPSSRLLGDGEDPPGGRLESCARPPLAQAQRVQGLDSKDAVAASRVEAHSGYFLSTS